MTRGAGFAFVVTLALGLGACAIPPGPDCARLAAMGWFCPLAPAALTPRSGVALITVRQAARESVYIGQLEITAAALRLAIANPAGVPMATLVWNGTTASVNPAGSGLKPLLLLALLELSYEEPARLRPALHGLSLDSTGTSRTLKAAGKIVAKVEYAGDEVRISVPHGGLGVTIRPLPGNRH